MYGVKTRIGRYQPGNWGSVGGSKSMGVVEFLHVFKSIYIVLYISIYSYVYLHICCMLFCISLNFFI